MLPSGSWAAYDPGYYKKFYDKWKREYDAHVRALEKGIEKGFEAVEKEGAQEVNAAEEMERAKVEIQEREERKALTAAAGAAPAAPEVPTITSESLAAASPMEQKQMLGEVIYMKIVA